MPAPHAEEEIPIHEIEEAEPALSTMAIEQIAPVETAPPVETRRERHPRLKAPRDDGASGLPAAIDRVAQRSSRAESLRFGGAQGHRRRASNRSSKSSTCTAAWCRSIPGPVVTTFEFKPEAGIKYSRITTLTRRSVPGPAGRIDPDRAHPRQADRRHRSSEHAARSDQPAPDPGVGRIPRFATRA